MKLGWTSFDEFKKYRKQSLLRSPSLPPALWLIAIIGLAVLITKFVTSLHMRNEALLERRLLQERGHSQGHCQSLSG
jgi:hypothetical protein